MVDVSDFTNTTITAPPGTSQHGQQNLICFPATWATVLFFFLVNYVAHALTTWRKPGEKTSEYLFGVFLALIFPITGLHRGLEAIYRRASCRGSWKDFLRGACGLGSIDYELDKAKWAGALGIITRDFQPSNESTESNSFFEYNKTNWDRPGARLYGNLPSSSGIPVRIALGDKGAMSGNTKGSGLLETRNISGFVEIQEISPYIVSELDARSAYDVFFGKQVDKEDENVKFDLAQSSNVLQILIAIAQLAYSAYSLLRKSGDQFRRYGYSSFDITVIPYIVMSFVNLVGNVLTPSYPCMYLVRTLALEEAESRGDTFHGCVGILNEQSTGTERWYEPKVLQGCPGAGQPGSQEQSSIGMSDLPTEAPKSSINGASVSHERLTANNSGPELDAIQICICPSPNGAEVCTEPGGSTINIQSGHPPLSERPKPSLPSFFTKDVFKTVGLLLAILIPFLLLIYHGVKQHNKGTVFPKVTILLWLLIGDVLGIYVMYINPHILNIVYDVNACWQVYMANFFKTKTIEDLRRKGGPTKEEERLANHARRVRWQLLSLVVGVLIGVAVATMSMYNVGTQLFHFGNCIPMST